MYVHGLGDAQEELARRYEETYDNTTDAALMKFAKTCKCNKCGNLAADDYYCDDIQFDGYDEATAIVWIDCFECGHSMKFSVNLDLNGTWKVWSSDQIEG